MSVEETEGVINGYLESLLHGGDFSAFFAEDIAWTTMETGDEVHGREAVRDYIVSLHSEMFQASPELRSLTVGDGRVALEATFVGKHVAEFAGIPASGKEVRLPYAIFYSVADGKITELRAYFPILALVQQLTGVAEARA